MERKELTELKRYKKMLYIVDMVNGFVKEGALHNKEYLKLLPEQIALIEKFQKEGEGIAFIRDCHTANSIEFKNYPPHCVIGTGEELVIDELQPYTKRAFDYPKNSTNGMYSPQMIPDLNQLENLEEAVIVGVCEDICDFNFAVGLKNYFDQMNRDVTVFAVTGAMDTFDAEHHNKEKFIGAAHTLMTQTGIILAGDINNLIKREEELGLVKKREVRR